VTTDIFERLQSSLHSTYTIDEELGGGGMSRVFLAREIALHRRVVIKVLPPELAPTVNIDRFRREIQDAATLQHPHIVPLLTAGEAGGVLYYVMPFIDGDSLRARLGREDTISVDEVLRILRDVASALEYAHGVGLVHRDIKPDNVLLSHGYAIVTDFGVAKALGDSVAPQGAVTSIGLAIGTPSYMAPEQIAADPCIDQRADIYALGVLAYELLVGHTPFAGRQPQALLAAHILEIPRPPCDLRLDISPELSALVCDCLAKLPEDRPQTAAAVLARLNGLQHTGGARTSSGGNEIVAGPEPVHGARTSHQLGYVLAALTLLLAAYGIVRWSSPSDRNALVRSGFNTSSNASLPARDRDEIVADKSIAVIPIVNVGNDSAGIYLSDGMTDELGSALGKVAGLRVVGARGAVATARGRTLDPRELANLLHVTTALQGSLHNIGGKVRLTVSLVSTRDGQVLWTDTYPLEPQQTDDVFRVRDEIVHSIAEEFHLTVAANQKHLLASHSIEDAQAYSLYLRGDYFAWNHPEHGGIDKALLYFSQAVARDSLFAAAYAGVALARVAQGLGNFGDYRPNEAFPAARAAAEHALRLDGSLTDAHTSLGAVMMFYDFLWAGAERELDRSVALDPRNTHARIYRAVLSEWMGRFDDAITDIRAALLVDPLDLTANAELGRAEFFARRYDEAEAQLRRTTELDPNYFRPLVVLGEIFLQQGKLDSADLYMHKALSAAPASSRMLSFSALAAVRAGRRDEAVARLDVLRRGVAAGRYIPAFDFAIIYLGLGDRDRTFEWLDKAVDDHSLRPFLMDPTFDSIRSDARYRALLRRLHLLA
jgi:eukaryotic-like serine/threonine-protein kinase